MSLASIPSPKDMYLPDHYVWFLTVCTCEGVVPDGAMPILSGAVGGSLVTAQSMGMHLSVLLGVSMAFSG